MKHYYCEECETELTYSNSYCGGKVGYEVMCPNCGVFYDPEYIGMSKSDQHD